MLNWLVFCVGTYVTKLLKVAIPTTSLPRWKSDRAIVGTVLPTLGTK